MVVVASLLLALTASLLWFKISLDSDSLFLENLSHDLFDLGGQWRDWKLTPAPAYFPDMLLYFSVYKILPNASSRIFFVSVAQVLMLTLAVVWLSKQIYPRLSHAATAMLILLLVFTTLVAARSNIWLYFYTTNNHFAALVVPLICVGLIIRIYAAPSFHRILLFILAAAIAQASTAVYLISFFAPAVFLMILLFAFCFVFRPYQKAQLRKILLILGMLVVSFLVALFIESLLTFNNPSEGRALATVPKIYLSLYGLVQATYNAFQLNNLSTFLFSCLVVASFYYLIFKLFAIIRCKEVNQYCRWVLCCALLLVVVPFNFGGVILSGGVNDFFAYRYFSFPIALILILPIILLDQRKFFAIKSWPRIFLLMSFVLLIFSIPALNKDAFRVFNRNILYIMTTPPYVAKCLIDIEKQGFVLQEGVADRWTAKGVSEFLPRKNWILSTFNDLYPNYFMTTLGPIKHPEHYGYYYNFIILRDYGAKNYFNKHLPFIKENLPMPDQIYECPSGKAEIWLYRDNALDAAVKATFPRFLALKKRYKNYQVLEESRALCQKNQENC